MNFCKTAVRVHKYRGCASVLKLTLLIVLLAVPQLGKSITLVDLPAASANLVVKDTCKGVTPGATTLYNGGKLGYWPPGTSGGVIDALKWQFGSTTVHNGTAANTSRPSDKTWSFDWSKTSLNGTLTVDYYKAFDIDGQTPTGVAYPDYCFHGARFTCDYVRATSDPVHLDWVQIVQVGTEWGGLSAGTLFVDPYPNDGTDDAPFYFNSTDDRSKFIYGSPAAGSLVFGDTPYQSHLEKDPWNGYFRADLFLASWTDANPRALTLYDGIRWGWDGYCVPELSSVAGFAIFALLCALSLRRMRRINLA